MTFTSTACSRHIFTALLAGFCLFIAAPQAHAAGFFIQEQSVSGLGTSFAGSAAHATDASTIFYNPAGMTQLSGPQTTAGISLLLPQSKMTDRGSTFGGAPIASTGNGGNPYDPSPVPSGYAAAPLSAFGFENNHDIWVGIGVSAPYGLASEYDDGWFGRYDSTKTELTVIDIAPSVAFKPTKWLSVGAGIDIQHASATLENAIFAGTEGLQSLKGDDWSYGYNIGFQIQPIETTTFGLHYRSQITQELTGRINITGSTGADANTNGGADLKLPDILAMSVAHKISPKTTLLGSATWFGWNRFDNIDPYRMDGGASPPIEQNYQTTWAFSIGAEHALNDRWTLRAGYQFDETPTTDEYRTSRTPDGDRNWFSAGAGYKINDKLTLDLAATYIMIDDEQINLRRNTLAPGVLPISEVNATTEGSVGIIATSLTYKF